MQTASIIFLFTYFFSLCHSFAKSLFVLRYIFKGKENICYYNKRCCVLSKGILALYLAKPAKIALEVVKQPSCCVLALVGTAKYTGCTVIDRSATFDENFRKTFLRSGTDRKFPLC